MAGCPACIIYYFTYLILLIDTMHPLAQHESNGANLTIIDTGLIVFPVEHIGYIAT